MTPTDKAIWFIESHFADDITLQMIAEMSHVSRHHLVRSFGAATGYSVMRYVRARRLSLAAVSLANGAPNILEVAIEAGYNSHEAFTRAFREQFGITPETIREQGHLNNINLTEPIIMSQKQFIKLQAPRIVNSQPLRIIGIAERYGEEASAQIPSQWQRFTPYIGSIDGQVGNTTYGVIYDGDEDGNYVYLCGVEVKGTGDKPKEFSEVTIPQQQYLVYTHTDHISTIQQSWNTIWNKALPESNYELVDAPAFERYGEQFDPVAGTGGIELWIPVTKK